MAQGVKDPALSLQQLGSHCCGTGLIPGLGTSTCHECGKERKREREKEREGRREEGRKEKGSIHQEDIATLNMYTLNKIISRYMKQKLMGLKGKLDKPTITVEDINTPHQ